MVAWMRFAAACVVAILMPAHESAFVLRAQNGDSQELQRTRQKMEEVGRSFRTFTAKMSQRKYTAILEEFDDPQTGSFYYARAKDGSALIRQEVSSPRRQILTVKGGAATVYHPTLKEAQVKNLGKDKDKAEYLALGIGQSPSELDRNFEISYKGDETIGAARCSILQFKPKSRRVAAMYASITMWVKKSSGVPIRYKFLEPNSDYVLVDFSDEKLNSKVPDAIFEQKLPKDVAIQRF